MLGGGGRPESVVDDTDGIRPVPQQPIYNTTPGQQPIYDARPTGARQRRNPGAAQDRVPPTYENSGPSVSYVDVAPGDVADHSPRMDWDEVKAVLEKLTHKVVLGWKVKDVFNEFLKPLGLERLKYIFESHNITGRALSMLSKSDMKDMKIKTVGDRVYLNELIHVLKKKMKMHDRDEVFWKGTVPAEGASCMYYESWAQCLGYKCCPCCMSQKIFEYTRQGLNIHIQPAACDVCYNTKAYKFHKLSFLKNMDWNTSLHFCGLWEKIQMDFFFLEAGAAGGAFSGHASAGHAGGTVGDPYKLGTFQNTSTDQFHIKLPNPDITEDLYDQLKFIWSEARLVASASGS